MTDGYGNRVSGAPIAVNLDGAKTYITDENGKIRVPTKGMAANNYVAKITFEGNENYTQSSTTAKVTITKAATNLAANDVTATYNVNKYLTITLKDGNGNPISGAKIAVKLKGTKTYITNKNGQVKINVAKLVPKSYTAKITFAGGANHIKSTKNVKVTVKKAKAKIIAKKKTFKRTKKVKKYKITLSWKKINQKGKSFPENQKENIQSKNKQ